MSHADPLPGNPFKPEINHDAAPGQLKYRVSAVPDDAAGQQAAQSVVLYHAGLALHGSLEPKSVKDAILEYAFNLCPQALSVRIYQWQSEQLSFGAARWSKSERNRLGGEPPPDATTYQAARTAREVFRNHPAPGDAILSLPLWAAEHLVAVLTINFPHDDHPDQESIGLLQLFARQAGIALQNALQHDHMSRQANTDGLTGLPNRRAFDDRLENETRRSSRYQHPFTLMMLDLDGFKAVNDLYGHPAGDKVLQDVAVRLRQSLRDSDFFARFGGDEFAIILPETDRTIAEHMAQRLIDVIHSWAGQQSDSTGKSISLSLGIATFPEDAMTGRGLLSAADRALYEMKSVHHHHAFHPRRI
jgi:diguanylate cyclase (GGDEF)-like protein